MSRKHTQNLKTKAKLTTGASSLSSSHLLTHLTTGANMLTITTTTSTTTEGLLYTSASADNHLTNTQELLVPIGGGVALLISVFVILSVFSLVYCPKRRRARVMEELQENQPVPKTPRTPGTRRGFINE